MLKRFFNSIFNFNAYDLKKYRVSLVFVVLVLGIIGMFLMQRLQDPEDPLFEKQILGFTVGLVVAIIISFVDYHFLCKLFVPLYLLSLGLLLFCRFTNKSMGLPVYGYAHYTAKRWIRIEIAGRTPEFMPSELTKFIMILVLAKLFFMLQKQVNKLYVLLLAGVLMGIPTLLVMTQTDLSTSIVLFLYFAVIVFAAGVTYKILLPLLGIGIPAFYALFWYVQQPFQGLLVQHQQDRILALLHPDLHPDEIYQQENAAAAIREGGLLGKLLTGDTSLRGTRNVPVVESDFIFAAVGEEFGFLGAVLVISLYVLFFIISVRIARKAKDYMGMLVAIGVAACICVQAFVNIGVVVSLLPNTGIPLPFVSSGLSALISNMMMLGLLLNVSIQQKDNAVKQDDAELHFRPDYTLHL